MKRTSRLRAGSSGIITVVALVLTVLAVPAARADDFQVCRVTIELTTGNDGIADSSGVAVSLGDDRLGLQQNTVVFDDADGDGAPGPFGDFLPHRGGTGDRPNTTFTWHGRLTSCVAESAVRHGFVVQHLASSSDEWDLRGLRISDPESGRVYHDQRRLLSIHGPVFHFSRETPLWHTTARRRGEVCRVEIIVRTGEDGIRDDSAEYFNLGGQDVIFEDANGDGRPDPYRYAEPNDPDPFHIEGTRFHKGGTGDAKHHTFSWLARLSPCIPLARLTVPFHIRHVNEAEDHRADNWDLQAITVADVDTGRALVHQAASSAPLHRFYKNSDQIWSTPVFPAGFPDPALDTDGDGLTDVVELYGIREADGDLDPWLAKHGADPCRKTVAVEIDWLAAPGGADRPAQKALDEAVQMFSDAPVPAPASCPYGWGATGGVQLLLDLSEGIEVSDAGRRLPLNVPDRTGQTDFDRYRRFHFREHRTGHFFYNLWGFTHNGSTSGGVCCLGPDDNGFLVTLGAWDAEKRTSRAQSATFVHELGHALGLQHGGGDRANYKPNYLSVMNYRYSATGIPELSAWRKTIADVPDGIDLTLDEKRQAVESVSHLGFSGAELPTLVQTSLNEGAGVGADRDLVTAWWDPSLALRAGGASSGLDWNFDNAGQPNGTASVWIMAGFEVCVAPRSIAGQAPQPVKADAVTGDQFVMNTQWPRGVILAGNDHDCDTPAAEPAPGFPGDAQVEPVGTHYPTKYHYASGVRGFNDWANLRIRIGAAAGPLPDEPDHGMTEEESDRAVVELFDALAGGSAPAAGSPRWAYAYVNAATTTEAPIGQPTTLNTAWQWSTGGGQATVTHTGTGRYEVRLPNVASPTGVAHVTAYRTIYRGRTCGVAGYRPSGTDELLDVRCFDQHGEPVDWWFTAFFAAPAAGAQPLATVRYPGGGSVDPVLNSGTYNSAGQVNRVLRDGPGRYRVRLTGAPFATGGGHVQLTPYGDGTPTRCAAEGRTRLSDALEVTVTCRAIAGGAPQDSGWLLSYTDGVGLHGDASVPAAHTETTGDPTNPSVAADRSWHSAGEVPTVTRLSTGWYRLTWTTGGTAGGNVQVTATGDAGSYCQLGAILDYQAPPRLSVDVYCSTPTGMPGDSTFGIAYVRRP